MQIELSYKELAKSISHTGEKIFVVSGKSFEYTGVSEKLLLSSDNFVRFSDFTENPKLGDVKKGVVAFKASGAKKILAVGGGTAIDIAKLIKHYSYTDLQSSIEGVPEAASLEQAAGVDLTVIPTTFGTGSESTHFAVMYVQGVKYSVAGPTLLPNGYILDSRLSKTLPKKVKAATCLDALCQAIESYWSKGATEESRAYASKAIRLIVENYNNFVSIEGAVSNEIAQAANYAGKAINITKTTAPHALSYILTSKYGVSHGHAVALFLRNMIEYHANFTTDVELSKTMVSIYHLMGLSTWMEAKELLNNMMSLGTLNTSLYDLGVISETDVDVIVSGVNVERLSNHPVSLDKVDLAKVLAI